jgi:hypothetical protein
VKEPAKHASPVSGVAPPVETRWKPGQSGNPAGHPKGYYPISAAEADLLSWPLEEVVKPLLAEGLEAKIPAAYRRRLKTAHLVAIGRIRAAADAENRSGVASAEHLADRTEGKVVNLTALFGADGVPLKVEWVNDWRGGESA